MMNLTDYGLTPNMLQEPIKGIPARVTAVHKERYALICGHGELYGRLKASVYYGKGGESFPTVGDFVQIDYVPDGDSRIIGTLPRRTYFSRRDPTPGRGEQAVAANFDYVFIMQSLNHDFNPKRLERYLTLSRQSNAIPVILLTKADLAEDHSSYLRAVQRVAAGVDAFAVSTKTGFGFDVLADYLKPRKTIVLLGSSGVGKSSLLNRLSGKKVMAVNDIRKGDGKGRHTTTARQLFMLESGVMVIDTPGMRELGMWDVRAGLDEAFADVEQYLGRCKFADCGHQSEPGCAVKAAIAKGELSLKRWESYVALKAEARYSDDKETYLKQKKQRYKEIAQIVRQAKKTDYRHTPCMETFTCKVCGTHVTAEGAGSGHRNHCPNCLSSIHVDNEPGDRASLCHGVMEAIGVWVRKNGEWALIHRCRTCGALSSNRIAADDNPTLLMSIAVKPLALPPFPLDRMGKHT